jgi:hypothetical protein
MSEYQYYEFLAIDRPLSTGEVAELRALSTRAEITPVSFVNEYHWGDFKGSPDKLMRRYFDAHVYLANWGSARFMLRIPLDALSRETANAFATGETFTIEASDGNWIIDWSLNPEDGGYDGMDEGQGWMARLVSLRDEIMRGDWRPLYLGWLAAVEQEECGDDTLEPPVPAGLAKLSPGQTALIEFLGIDEDWVQAAAAGSREAPAEEPPDEEALAWLDALPPAEAKDLLRMLLAGESRQAECVLKARYAAWRRSLQPAQEPEAQARTVAQLRVLAEAAHRERERRQAEERARAEAERRKKREEYLAVIAADTQQFWQAAHREAERGTASGYDEASRFIKGLAEACTLYSSRQDFERDLQEFMKSHAQRKALVRRLADAGLWPR